MSRGWLDPRLLNQYPHIVAIPRIEVGDLLTSHQNLWDKVLAIKQGVGDTRRWYFLILPGNPPVL